MTKIRYPEKEIILTSVEGVVATIDDVSSIRVENKQGVSFDFLFNEISAIELKQKERELE